jgi:hypothetical protein
MILKASARSGGANLAAHLSRLDENDHVRVHELRGFAGSDLHEAFQEAQAISRATKCKNYLFSLSLNPPQDAHPGDADFEAAIDMVEKKLGLSGQPRAVVIHEKQGRIHAHCVWSRIDADTLKALPLDFYKNRLQDCARELYLRHGWDMPRGLLDTAKRDPNNFNLAEWQQAKRLGTDPRWLKAIVQDCWARSDSKPAFERSLSEHAIFLARGDRRGFVIVDHTGEVHSLSRALGVKQKDLGARLGDPASLNGVEDAKANLAKRMAPAIKRHIDERRAEFAKRTGKLDERRVEMTTRQRGERASMANRQKIARDQATRERAARLPTGLRGLWHRITGKYRESVRDHGREAEAQRAAQAIERQQLAERQLVERRELQTEIKSARTDQAARLREIRREVGRFLAIARVHDQRRDLSLALGSSLKLQR